MNLLLTALLATATLGSAAIAFDPTCQDLAGQGTLCHDVQADPGSGVDADVILTLAPQVPPLPPPPAFAAVAAPTCQDLAGQGFACADVTADPASGVDADVVVVIAPQPPVA